MHDFFYNLTTLTCQNYSVNPQKNTTTTPASYELLRKGIGNSVNHTSFSNLNTSKYTFSVYLIANVLIKFWNIMYRLLPYIAQRKLTQTFIIWTAPSIFRFSFSFSQ